MGVILGTPNATLKYLPNLGFNVVPLITGAHLLVGFICPPIEVCPSSLYLYRLIKYISEKRHYLFLGSEIFLQNYTIFNN